MTGEQADEIYQGLIGILREERLDWIIDEAETAVRVGKTEAVEVELGADDETPRRRRVPVLQHVQREWTAEERLAILLEAMDAAMCKPVTLETDLPTLLPELEGREIAFAPGGFEEDLPKDLWRERTLRIAATEVGDPNVRPYLPWALLLDRGRQERREHADRLFELLHNLRRELNADLD